MFYISKFYSKLFLIFLFDVSQRESLQLMSYERFLLGDAKVNNLFTFPNFCCIFFQYLTEHSSLEKNAFFSNGMQM
jgi:hypothetical protein